MRVPAPGGAQQGGGAMFGPFGLAGNINDYAWGPNGLDAILTRV